MASLGFTVEIPAEQLAELRAQLDPEQVKRATFGAVKRATAAGATFVKRIVRKNSTLGREDIDGRVKAVAPAGDPPAGTIKVSQKLVPLAKFRFSALKRGGVSVKISKDRPPVKLAHAFVATMRSGHQGIYQRARGRTARGRSLTPAGFAGRLPIVEQFGPSVLDLVQVPDTTAAIEERIQEILVKRLESGLSRFAAVNAAKAEEEES